MLILREYLIQLIAIIILALVLFHYAPSIGEKLSQTMDKATHAGEITR